MRSRARSTAGSRSSWGEWRSRLGHRSTYITAPVHVWTHVALVYRHGTPGSVETYQNGALVDTLVASGLIGDSSPAQDELPIGGRATGNNQWFHGLPDEVRLWNVARTSVRALPTSTGS
ncbi:MAG: hypothetical protein IPK00_24310 [Deltaproteobacteria bacterium]|nr:hypothetical protein [Deltaproteobacteria bacterium]